MMAKIGWPFFNVKSKAVKMGNNICRVEADIKLTTLGFWWFGFKAIYKKLWVKGVCDG